jgi:hypothetical protein
MTKEELAAVLNGRQRGDETTPEIERLAKESGLCIAFGASDDLLEFRGTVYDEVGSWNGAKAFLTPKGNVKQSPKPGRICVQSSWCPKDINGKVWVSWLIQVQTEVNFATFDIFEDGELYCRGCVFNFKPVEP